MNRRSFLKFAGLGAATATAVGFGLVEMEEVNRVYSFPKQIRLAHLSELVYYPDFPFVLNPRQNVILKNIRADFATDPSFNPNLYMFLESTAKGRRDYA